jgi:hypothetical protein
LNPEGVLVLNAIQIREGVQELEEKCMKKY